MLWILTHDKKSKTGIEGELSSRLCFALSKLVNNSNSRFESNNSFLGSNSCNSNGNSVIVVVLLLLVAIVKLVLASLLLYHGPSSIFVTDKMSRRERERERVWNSVMNTTMKAS